uniref:SFRICE_019408 n=1 Tax=Spodoptera frugiperda TaxID=7108 RepID=A0A2H1V990_SPOFR
MIDKISYSYATYDPFTNILRSQLRIKTITKIGQRSRKILVTCIGTQQPDESLLEETSPKVKVQAEMYQWIL